MRKRPGGWLLTGAMAATAAVALGLGVTPSLASTATTWTVKPGGKFSATNTSKITVRDTTTGVVISCNPSSLAGKLKSGSGLPGIKIGAITAFSFSACHGPAGITYALMTSASKARPWKLNAESYDTASGETSATVTGIVAAWSGFGCTVTISAANPVTPGRLEVKYTDSAHKLQLVASGSNLHLHNVSAGCVGLWNSGDHLTIVGTYAVAPAQTISRQ